MEVYTNSSATEAGPCQLGPDVRPAAPLPRMTVSPIPFLAAKEMLVRHHYLKSIPGGTMLSIGVFVGGRLLGVVTFGAGPFNVHSLVRDASPDDCLTLTRLWLFDELPRNSESRVLGLVLRAIKANAKVKFIVTYADPEAGHVGTIYQAANWTYTGLSDATPRYQLGDGVVLHSRTFSTIFGTHSLRHLAAQGVSVSTIATSPKFRYLYFLDPSWRSRLKVAALPFPKKEALRGGH